MPDFEDSYLGQIRKLVGNRKIIVTGARAVVQDPEGRILFIRRRDNGKWAMPAGSQELDETIVECLVREVREETGLEVASATLMAMYSSVSSESAYGNPHHLFIVQFLVEEWSGDLVTDTDETVDARFYAPDEIPQDIPEPYGEVLQDLRDYDGTLIIR